MATLAAAGIKRVRAWEGCEDMQELKAILEEKEEQLERMKTQMQDDQIMLLDKDEQIQMLSEELKKSKAAGQGQPVLKQRKISPIFESQAKPKDDDSAQKLRKNIQQQILKQMFYTASVKYKAKKISVEMLRLSESDLKSILGDSLFSKASRGPKLIKVTASEDDVGKIFEGEFSKSLRYGSELVLDDGLTFTYNKGTSVLKIAGSFRMIK